MLRSLAKTFVTLSKRRPVGPSKSLDFLRIPMLPNLINGIFDVLVLKIVDTVCGLKIEDVDDGVSGEVGEKIEDVDDGEEGLGEVGLPLEVNDDLLLFEVNDGLVYLLIWLDLVEPLLELGDLKLDDNFDKALEELLEDLKLDVDDLLDKALEELGERIDEVDDLLDKALEELGDNGLALLVADIELKPELTELFEGLDNLECGLRDLYCCWNDNFNSGVILTSLFVNTDQSALVKWVSRFVANWPKDFDVLPVVVLSA